MVLPRVDLPQDPADPGTVLAHQDEEVLADEIIQAAAGDTNSHSVKKKNEQERVAMASR